MRVNRHARRVVIARKILLFNELTKCNEVGPDKRNIKILGKRKFTTGIIESFTVMRVCNEDSTATNKNYCCGLQVPRPLCLPSWVFT